MNRGDNLSDAEADDMSVLLAPAFPSAAVYSWQIWSCCVIREEEYQEYQSELQSPESSA